MDLLTLNPLLVLRTTVVGTFLSCVDCEHDAASRQTHHHKLSVLQQAACSAAFLLSVLPAYFRNLHSSEIPAGVGLSAMVERINCGMRAVSPRGLELGF